MKKPSKKTTAKTTATPAPEGSNTPTQLKFRVTFEDTIDVSDTDGVGVDLSADQLSNLIDEAKTRANLPDNVLAIHSAKIEVDDEDEDDVTVKAIIVLIVTAENERAAGRMDPPEDLLEEIADLLEDESSGLGMDRANEWELTDTTKHNR